MCQPKEAAGAEDVGRRTPLDRLSHTAHRRVHALLPRGEVPTVAGDEQVAERVRRVTVDVVVTHAQGAQSDQQLTLAQHGAVVEVTGERPMQQRDEAVGHHNGLHFEPVPLVEPIVQHSLQRASTTDVAEGSVDETPHGHRGAIALGPDGGGKRLETPHTFSWCVGGAVERGRIRRAAYRHVAHPHGHIGEEMAVGVHEPVESHGDETAELGVVPTEDGLQVYKPPRVRHAREEQQPPLLACEGDAVGGDEGRG